MRKCDTGYFRTAVFCAILLLPAVLIPSCAAAAPAREDGTAATTAQESGVSFTDVEGREWMLAEVRKGGVVIVMDREKLAANNFAGAYSILFEGDRISGMGAPNRYFAPYTAGPNKTLSIGNIAGTLMMALFEPEGLRENEFFALLSNTARWDLVQGKLEIYSEDAVGNEAALIFVRD